MDDESGWHDILLGLWTEDVRDAVVARVEWGTEGRHGWLVRVAANPEGVPGRLTETVHTVVLAAIRDETGANLDQLGSQAAWECYAQVWDRLLARWADGGTLAVAPLGQEPELVRLISSLPPAAAASAGAYVGDGLIDPLWLAGRLRIDRDGLEAFLRREDGRCPAEVRARVRAILDRTGDGR